MSKYFQAPWSYKDVLIVLLIVIGLIIGLNLTLLYFGVDEILRSMQMKELVIAGVFLAQSIILLVPVAILAIKKERKWKWQSFGFNRLKFFEHFGMAVQGYVIYLGIVVLVTSLIVFGGLKIPGYQIPEPILPIFGSTNIAYAIAAVIIIGLAPLLEEVFFRGFVLQGLVNKMGRAAGAIATALLFAVLHLQFSNFIPIFILGLILSFLFIRAKSIWPCIWFHIINNIIAFSIELMIVKEVIPLDF